MTQPSASADFQSEHVLNPVMGIEASALCDLRLQGWGFFPWNLSGLPVNIGLTINKFGQFDQLRSILVRLDHSR